MVAKKKAIDGMQESAAEAANLLKALANEDRLLVLCHLAQGEKNVTELQALLDVRQPTLSQQLARLRFDRLVVARREGKAIYYSLASTEAGRVLELLYEMYCSRKKPAASKGAKPRRVVNG